MISDSTLMKVSLIMTIIGIFALFIITLFSGSIHMKIGEIDEADIGKNVIINGTVLSYSEKGGNVFMNVGDISEIKVVIFEKDAKNIPVAYLLNSGDFVEIEGKIQLYDNELEIIAGSVKRI